MFEEALQIRKSAGQAPADFDITPQNFTATSHSCYHPGYDCLLHVWTSEGRRKSKGSNAVPFWQVFVEYRNSRGACCYRLFEFDSPSAALEFVHIDVSSLNLKDLCVRNTRAQPVSRPL